MIRRFTISIVPGLLRASSGMLILVPLTTYYLEREDFGLFALLQSIGGIVVILGSLGSYWLIGGKLKSVSSRELADWLTTLLTAVVAIGLLLAGILWVSAPTIFAFFDLDMADRGLFAIAIGTALISLLWPIASALLTLTGRIALHSGIEIVGSLVQITTIAAALLLIGLRETALYLGPLAIALTTGICGLAVLWPALRTGRPKRSLFVGVFKVGGPATLMPAAEGAQTLVLRSVLSQALGLGTLGVYGHSESYRGVLMMFSKALARVYAPELMRLFAAEDTGGRLIAAMRVVAAGMAIAGIFAALFSDNVLEILTHGLFTDAAPLVFAWFILSLVALYGVSYTHFLIYLQRTKALAATGLAGPIVGMATAYPLIKVFGAMGAALAVILAMLVVQITRTVLCRRLGIARLPEPLLLLAAALSLLAFAVETMAQPTFGLEVLVFLGFALSAVLVFRPLRHFRSLLRG